MEDRLKLFASLKPSSYLVGTAQFASYIGAQFADDLVVFENAYYGDALYVLYDNWRDVSKRSRIDLLKGTSERFDQLFSPKPIAKVPRISWIALFATMKTPIPPSASKTANT